MGALTEMWKQVAAQAEKDRLAIPVWRITADEEDGYEFVRAPTAEAAKAAYIAEFKPHASIIPWLVVTRATPEQIQSWGGK